MNDNITPLFPELKGADEGEPKLPVWLVTFKDDTSMEIYGDIMMSPLTYGFYDFNKDLDTVVAVDMVKAIQKDGYITKTEWAEEVEL